MESKTLDKTIRKSLLPKKIVLDQKVQTPPTKNVFEKSLRNDKVFMEDKLAEKENGIKRTVVPLRKSISRDRTAVFRREDLLEKELNEKNLKLKELQEKQTRLENEFNELRSFKLKYDQENVTSLEEKKIPKEDSVSNHKQISYLNKTEDKFDEIGNIIEKYMNDTNVNQYNDSTLSKIFQLFVEFKAKKENENKILLNDKIDLETKLANCIQSIESLNKIIIQSDASFLNSTIKRLENELKTVLKEQAADKERIQSLETSLNAKEIQLKESLLKQSEIEETIDMLNDFKSKISEKEHLLITSNQDLKEKLSKLEENYSSEKEKNELLTKNLKARETELNFFLSKNNLNFAKVNDNNNNIQHSSDYFEENFNRIYQLKHENINDFIDPNELLLVENQTFTLNEKPLNLRKQTEKRYKLAEVPVGLKVKRSFKLVFLGDSGVGKTSFIKRVCHNVFEESLSATVGLDYETRLIYVDEQVASLKFWDTAGQERYRSIVKSYYRETDCFICMFDVNDEKSFLNLRSWISSIADTSEENFLLVIIGNKVDLNEDEQLRAVKHKDGEALAKVNEGIYFELSAKECINVFQTIESITRALFQKFQHQIVKNSIRSSNNELVPNQKRCFFF